MNMTDMMLQMYCQSLQMPKISASQSSKEGSKTSEKQGFQELLKEKQTATTRQEASDTTQTSGKENEDPVVSEEQTAQAVAANMTQPLVWDYLVQAPANLSQESLVAATVVPTDGTAKTAGEFFSSNPVTGTQVTTAQSSQQTAVIAQPETAQKEVSVLSSENQNVKVADQTGVSETMSSLKSLEANVPQEKTVSLSENGSESLKEDVSVLENAAGGMEQPLFAETESLPVKVGEPEVLDTTQDGMDQKLAKTISDSLDKGMQKVELRLSPQNLGNVVVEMTRSSDGTLHVVLHADNERAMNLLGEHSASLGALLSASGHGDTKVEVPQPHQENQQWQQPDSDGGQGQNGRSGEQNRQRQSAEDFLQQLRLELLQPDLTEDEIAG